MPIPLLNMFSQIGSGMTQLRDDVTRMIQLRIQLARLELNKSLTQVAWLAAVVMVCVLLVSAGLVLLLLLAAAWLAGRLEMSPEVAQASLAGVLILLACVCGWLAYRRFRRTFSGFRESLAELHEDLVWLGELTGTQAGETDD